MNTTKKIIAGGIATVAIASAVAFSPFVSAYQGDMTKTGPNHTEEREQAMTQVMEKKDLAAWQKLMTENGRTPGVLNKVDTQAEFDKFSEAWKLAKAGKVEEANKIRAELGLGTGNGSQNKNGGRGQNRSGNFSDANKDGVCDNAQ